MRTILVAFFGLVIAGTLSHTTLAQSVRTRPTPKTETAIRAVIEAQRDAWNRGDIAGYMDGYARSADTVFISGDNVTHGWQTVLERYQKGYNTREKMGVLTFSDLEFNQMSRDAVAVSGSWHLQRAGDQPHGRFTLIFRRTKAGWRIVHDHTSSA
ncbi:MAG: hypothetical protein QOD75_1552 [Blastocatellia bacterium]|jgi:ketosteroid isomerase-like protein|nr:hypothetical protein [Blastocatellia bacterium]